MLRNSAKLVMHSLTLHLHNLISRKNSLGQKLFKIRSKFDLDQQGLVIVKFKNGSTRKRPSLSDNLRLDMERSILIFLAKKNPGWRHFRGLKRENGGTARNFGVNGN